MGRLITNIRAATITQTTILPLLTSSCIPGQQRQLKNNRQYEQWGKGGSGKLKLDKAMLKYFMSKGSQ